MPPPEGKHDVSRARPAAYNNGSPRAPVSLQARGGISPPARLLASRCLGSPFWQHHFAAKPIHQCDTSSHHPSKKQMDVGMIVGKKRVQRASIAPQMARAVFIPPTYPDQISRPGIPARGPPAIAPRPPRRRVSPSVRQSVSPSVRQPVSPSARQPVSPSARQPVSPSARQHINLATPACTPIKTGALTAPVTKGRWPGLSPGWPDPRGRRTPA